MTVWNLTAGPGTHALVVGVGRYPHLVDGDGPRFKDHSGMGQLTSAPVSARAFADWLVGSFRSPTHPLCSLELLISDSQPVTYQPPRPGADPQAVEPATFSNFEAAVLRWYDRLNTSADNRAVVYFCGHGIAAGLQTTLLLEDFGDVPHAVLRRALDFNRFYVGMDSCAARTQCFFIDACRVASPTLFRKDSYGESILDPDKKHRTPARLAPAFFSALPGTAAYGRPGRPSLYTSALLKAMGGPGAVLRESTWEIQPSALSLALWRLLKAEAARYGATQACSADHVSDFPLHELPGLPDVPVTVRCNKPINLATAMLRVVSNTVSREQPPPVPSPWSLDLPVGMYQFVAEPEPPPPDQSHKRDAIVYPPFTEVVLPWP